MVLTLGEKLRALENGLVLTRYYMKKRPEKLTFRVKRETAQLIWIRSMSSYRPDGAVDLRTIKEIRVRDPIDKEVKEFDKWPHESDKNRNLCVSIHYGAEFVHSRLSVQAQTPDELDTLIAGLNYLREDAHTAVFSTKIERWLWKEFNEIRGKQDTISLSDIKKWLTKSYYRIATPKLKDYFKECNLSVDSQLTFEMFSCVYNRLMYCKAFKEYFDTYFQETVPGSLPIVTADQLAAFLLSENHDSQAEDRAKVSEMMSRAVEGQPRSSSYGAYFTSHEFVNYLFCSDNSIWHPDVTRIYQDMDQPISNYFIASSHNTYLTGDQIASNSSTEAYVQALRMGARCVELDCWDGPDNMPYIFHGRTLTSKIKFIDVVKGIKKYAWQFSEYPIILSIENHCSLPQQKKMAQVFQEVFGDDLLVMPVDRKADRLPSPNQLKRKFILKHKKLTSSGMGDVGVWRMSDEEAVEAADISQSDVSHSRKTGMLYLQDPVNYEEWNTHFFMLTNTGLYFTDQTDYKEDDDDDDTVSMNSLDLNGSIDEAPLEQRHHYEPWFHGRLQAGDARDLSDRLLKQYSVLGNATFLVRESDTFRGSYTLSFWQHDRPNHCRIKSRQEHGQTKYFLVDNLVFDSLYELIEHYRNNKLRSANFELMLKEPVPKQMQPYGKDWYHEDLDRVDAEEMLARIPKDGAFLIRRRVQNDGAEFAISFRAENKIKHCRIQFDRSHMAYMIGSATFDSLPELVSYYQKHPLYRKMKLRYAVNQALVNKCGQSDNDVAIYGCGIYTQPNEVQTDNVLYRALCDYQRRGNDELSFKKGEVIMNVIQKSSDWWLGDCGDQCRKLFPRNYVELIEDGLGSLQQGSINLSSFIKCEPASSVTGSTSDSVLPKKLHVLQVHHSGDQVLKVACTNPKEYQDWLLEICQAAGDAKSRNMKNADIQKKFQIAKEFSDLVIYCRSTPYRPEAQGSYYEMTSFSEAKAEKVCTKKDNKGRQFMNYNTRQFSRVYPKGQRIDSSNYDPMPPWNCGAHMLALNYQTPDKTMQINQGRFTQNGLCGYILQPPCLKDSDYDPFDKRSLLGVDPMTISILVIAGRHLFKRGKGIPSPFVEVEILGCYYEDSKKFKTDKKLQDALHPVWNEATDFDIVNPDLAMIRFCVQDEDVFGDPNFLGQATIPVRCLRPGYRSIPLLNDYSEPLELASLLVKIDIVNPNDTEYSNIYTTLSSLRDEKMSLKEKVNEAQDINTQDRLKQQLDALEGRIEEQLDHRRKRSTAIESYQSPVRLAQTRRKAWN